MNHMLTDDQKARLLHTWAKARDRAGADLHEVLYIDVYANMAGEGTLLHSDETPDNWRSELDYRRRILAIVEAIDASMPAGVNDLQEWVAEIRAAVAEAERMAAGELGPQGLINQENKHELSD
jgi:hypothetical protein